MNYKKQKKLATTTTTSNINLTIRRLEKTYYRFVFIAPINLIVYESVHFYWRTMFFLLLEIEKKSSSFQQRYAK